MPLRDVSLGDLVIDDERSFRHIGVYLPLKLALARSGHRFRVPAAGTRVSWDRALLLNLTFWSADEAADVLCDDHIPADVVAHAALHRIVGARVAASAAAVGAGAASAQTALGLLLAESIASAFDLYL